MDTPPLDSFKKGCDFRLDCWFSYCRPLACAGVLSGIMLGVKDRAFEGVRASAHSAWAANHGSNEAFLAVRRACQLGPSYAPASAIHAVMQPVTSGFQAYLPALIPVGFVFGKVIWRTVAAAADNKINSLWESFKSQIRRVPAKSLTKVTLIIVTAVASTYFQNVWLPATPSWLISTAAPGEEIMHLTISVLAASSAANMMSEAGHHGLAAVASTSTLVLGLANSVLLQNSVSHCYSMFEVYDGLKWAVAVGIVSTALAKSIGLFASKFFGGCFFKG